MKLPKNIIEKARDLDRVRMLKHVFEREEKELVEILRPYVEGKGKKDEDGYKAVWNEELKIRLEPSPKIEISPAGLYALLKKKAFEFFLVMNGELGRARKSRKVDLSDADIIAISKRSEGAPRVKVEIKNEKKKSESRERLEFSEFWERMEEAVKEVDNFPKYAGGCPENTRESFEEWWKLIRECPGNTLKDFNEWLKTRSKKKGE
jgi:hypothetical protein